MAAAYREMKFLYHFETLAGTLTARMQVYALAGSGGEPRHLKGKFIGGL
jgi:hypothetical protein